MYGPETWAVTATTAKTFDALDQWCLRRILNRLDRAHHQQRGPIKNPTTITVWRSPLQTPSLLWSHLQSWPQSGSFSGTVRQYYWSALALEEKIRPAEIDLVTNYRERSTATQSGSDDSSTARAQNRTAWQTLVETATSLTSSGWWWWWLHRDSCELCSRAGGRLYLVVDVCVCVCVCVCLCVSSEAQVQGASCEHDRLRGLFHDAALRRRGRSDSRHTLEQVQPRRPAGLWSFQGRSSLCVCCFCFCSIVVVWRA